MDTIERTAPSQAKLLEELPLRLHHNAYVVKDHEANRRFIEDLLGIRLRLGGWRDLHGSTLPERGRQAG